MVRILCSVVVFFSRKLTTKLKYTYFITDEASPECAITQCSTFL